MNMRSATEYRDEAARQRKEREDSFDRCDTDGFVSQWASGLQAQKLELAAQLAEAGGLWEFPALARVSDGAIVNAKKIDTRYGVCWMIPKGPGVKPDFCPTADVPGSDWVEGTGYVPTEPVDEYGYTLKSQKRLAKRGYRQVKEKQPGVAVIRGQGYGLSGTAWACIVPASEASESERAF